MNSRFEAVQGHIMSGCADIVRVDVCRVDQWMLNILKLKYVPVATKFHRGRVAQPKRGYMPMHPVPLHFVRHDPEIGRTHYVHVEADDLPVSVIPLMQPSSGGVKEVLQPEDVVESILHVRHMRAGPKPSFRDDIPIWYLNQVNTCAYDRFCVCIPVDIVDPRGSQLSGENLVAGGWW